MLVTGTPMALPNWKLHDIVEKAGAVVVGEEMCTGSRYYQDLVSEDAATLDEMIDDIAEKYLDINCACFTPNEGRIEDVVRMAKEHGADGVIDYTLNFCGLYAMEQHGVEQAVQDAGLPVLTHRDRLLDGGRRPALDARRGASSRCSRADAAKAHARTRARHRFTQRRRGLARGGQVVDAAVTDSGFDPQAAARVFVDREASRRDRGDGLRAARRAGGVRLRGRHGDQGLRDGVERICSRMRRASSTSAGRTPRSSPWAPAGKVIDFEMNDKCAAGTGKFLEVMAKALGFALEQMAAAGARGRRGRHRDLEHVHGVRGERGHRARAPRRRSRGGRAGAARVHRQAHAVVAQAHHAQRGHSCSPAAWRRTRRWSSSIRAGFEGEVLVPEEAQTVGALGAALSYGAGAHE